VLVWVRDAWPATLLFTLLNEYANDKDIVLFSLLVANGRRVCEQVEIHPYEAVLKRVRRLHSGDVAIDRVWTEIVQPLVLEQWMNTPDVVHSLPQAAPATLPAPSEVNGIDNIARVAELIELLKSVPTLEEKPHPEVCTRMRLSSSQRTASVSPPVSHHHRCLLCPSL
jgi:hypothetical protein